MKNSETREDDLFAELGGGPSESDLKPKNRIRKRLEKVAKLPAQGIGPTPFETAHPTVVAWLKQYTGNFSFYVSLKEQFQRNGDLSERQIESIYKAIERDSGSKPPMPVPFEVARAFDAWFKVFIGSEAYAEINHPVVDAFRAALAEKIKPAREFSIKPGEVIRINKFLAKKIGHESGLNKAHFVMDVIEVKDETPKAYLLKVKMSAQRSGHCCICGLKLDNPESITNGIGPVCGDGYQLNWKSDRDVLTQLSEKLMVAQIVETWLPKSAIKERLVK